MSRNSHDGAGTVSGKDVVADPDGDVLTGKGIDSVCSGKDTGNLLVHHALALGLALCSLYVLGNGLLLLRRGYHIHVFALGGENHECYAEDSVGAGGENLQVYIGVSYMEKHLGALAAANPVALCLLEAVGPVYLLKAFEKALGVCRHAKAPLVHHLLLDGISATYAHALADLIVGKNSAEFGAPVDKGVAEVGDAVVHQHVALFLMRHGLPLVGGEMKFLRAVGMDAFGAFFLEMLLEVGYGHGLVLLSVVVRQEHALEGPLRPLIVFGVAGAYLAVPVVAHANLVELAAIAGDVYSRCLFGVLAGLNGILLGGQAVGVVAHGMEDVEALQTLVAREDVAGDVSQGMTHMQTCSRGVREHVKNIVLGTRRIGLNMVHALVGPLFLPFRFYCFMIVFHIIELFYFK